MLRLLQCRRGRGAGKTALSLLFAAACAALLPEAARALGGPWPIAVTVEGEVRRPGAYTLPHNATLSSLLIAAGGFTEDADPRGAALFRLSARAAGKAELDNTAGTLALETGGSEAAGNALRPVVALLMGLTPSGRVPVRMTHPRLLKNSPDDLRLEEGDVLRVPARADTVAVAGAVAGAAAEAARGVPARGPLLPGRAPEGYIRPARGFAGAAARGAVYLLRADGTTALLTPGFVSWNPAASRWEVTALTRAVPAIGPGDTIVVPRPPLPGLPRGTARRIPKLLMRAAEIAGAAVVLPGAAGGGAEETGAGGSGTEAGAGAPKETGGAAGAPESPP
jgi:hypothetical protein